MWQDCAVLHGMRHRNPVHVGEYVTIGHNATVHGCVIEDACLIGIGAAILNNAKIGGGIDRCGGEHRTARGSVRQGRWWLGSRAKVRRDLTTDDRELILKYARNYLDYTKIYLKERKKWQS